MALTAEERAELDAAQRKRIVRMAADIERYRVIAAMLRGDGLTLWGTPVKVTVELPKDGVDGRSREELVWSYDYLVKAFTGILEMER